MKLERATGLGAHRISAAAFFFVLDDEILANDFGIITCGRCCSAQRRASVKIWFCYCYCHFLPFPAVPLLPAHRNNNTPYAGACFDRFAGCLVAKQKQ